MWSLQSIKRLFFLRKLASEEQGGVVVGNLFAALDGKVLSATLANSWLDRALRQRKGKTHFDNAFAAVIEGANELHFRGRPADFSPGTYLVSFRQASAVRAAIESQQAAGAPGAFLLPPRDADLPAFLIEQREDILRRLKAGSSEPVLQVFNARYPAWYAKREGDFDLKIERARLQADIDDGTKELVRVLRYLGLPLQGGQSWMMILFKPAGVATLHRPTVFEGFDGPFFKQRPVGSVDGNWGATTDLDPNDGGDYVLQDGAIEAVGRTMTVLDVVDSYVFPPVPFDVAPTDDMLRRSYSKELLAFVAPKASTWRAVADRVVGIR